MKERKKSLAPRILAIILCVLLLFTAALSIVIAANHVEKGELPYFFGIGVCSYNGAYDNDKDKIPQNAMIFTKKVDSKALRAGEVVVFYYADAPTLAKLYLASVLEVKEDGSLELYLGEAYGRRTVAAENLRGQMSFVSAVCGLCGEHPGGPLWVIALCGDDGVVISGAGVADWRLDRRLWRTARARGHCGG